MLGFVTGKHGLLFEGDIQGLFWLLYWRFLRYINAIYYDTEWFITYVIDNTI
jgi:hypothetical protein